jgi:hypothetical protein
VAGRDPVFFIERNSEWEAVNECSGHRWTRAVIAVLRPPW